MRRIKIYIDYDDNANYRSSKNSDRGIWRVSAWDAKLVNWLRENVGKASGGYFALPLRGEGWMISEGYNGDDYLDDWAWRGYNLYSPKGEYGYWLQIDDDDKAVLLHLSGLLDDRPRGKHYHLASLDYVDPHGPQ